LYELGGQYFRTTEQLSNSGRSSHIENASFLHLSTKSFRSIRRFYWFDWLSTIK